jgi:probable HAF family extracellular repeat protein
MIRSTDLQHRCLFASLTNSFVIILGVIFGTIVSPLALGQTTAYTVIELPAAADGGLIGLNNLGDVAGRAGKSFATDSRAIIWRHDNSPPKELAGLFQDEYSSASAVNDLGQVIGASNTDTAIVPFIWQPTGGMQRVPIPSGDNGGQAFGINKSGDVVGCSSGPRGERAFMWGRTSGVRDLGVLPGGSYSRARDVNDPGEIVGTSSSPVGDHAVLWGKIGGPRDLGTLPGDTSSEAFAINNDGAVVGTSKGRGGTRAFLWTKGSGMQDLGMLPGGHSSRAFDINDAGTVVGTSTSSLGSRAFIWTQDRGMKDLNGLVSTQRGLVYVEARAINSKGQIVVTGTDHHRHFSTGEKAATEDRLCAPAPGLTFLLTPVPAR